MMGGLEPEDPGFRNPDVMIHTVGFKSLKMKLGVSRFWVYEKKGSRKYVLSSPVLTFWESSGGSGQVG